MKELLDGVPGLLVDDLEFLENSSPVGFAENVCDGGDAGGIPEGGLAVRKLHLPRVLLQGPVHFQSETSHRSLAMPDTRIGNYAAFRHKFGTSNIDYFLERGQAVNFWAEYCCVKGADSGLVTYHSDV